MSEITITSQCPDQPALLVVPVALVDGELDYRPVAAHLPQDLVLPTRLKAGEYREIYTAAGRRVIYSVGDGSPTAIRTATATVVRALADSPSFAILCPELDAAPSPEHGYGQDHLPGDFGLTQAVTEGACAGAYRFDTYRTDPDRDQPVTEPAQITIISADTAGFERGRTLAAGIRAVRDLVNEPPNVLSTTEFVRRVEAASDGLEVNVIDSDKLAELGCGGILAVGRGSATEPYLVQVSYRPAAARSHIAIVGKGITYDSGGLSLKPATGQLHMKSDMAGAATAWQFVRTAAALELDVRVDAWLALAENMPSGDATRVDDVVTMSDGSTVEVTNTDAEGRMVMADALVQARATEPDLLLDIATLTGAQIYALGTEVGAVMGRDDACAALISAAARAGEPLWRMPLSSSLKPALRSPIADQVNAAVSWSKGGGVSIAGLFLKHFAGSGAWAHLDIAGPSFNTGSATGEFSSGGTGYGLRTLIEVAQNWGRN